MGTPKTTPANLPLLLCLVAHTAKPVEKECPAVAKGEREQKKERDDDRRGIHQRRGIIKKEVKEHAYRDHSGHAKGIADIHGTKKEARLHLKAQTADRAVGMHLCKVQDVAKGMLKHIPFSAPGTFTGQ